MNGMESVLSVYDVFVSFRVLYFVRLKKIRPLHCIYYLSCLMSDDLCSWHDIVIERPFFFKFYMLTLTFVPLVVVEKWFQDHLDNIISPKIR